MSKPSNDLSALFRSLRPDETVFQESTGSIARDAEHRWPLFNAIAPSKPQETPALSAQERQRWVSQEKPSNGVRKPALSLPGLSDKMSRGLDKMSLRSAAGTSVVKPAVRRASETSMIEAAPDRSSERSLHARSAPASVEPPETRDSNVGRGFPAPQASGANPMSFGSPEKKEAVVLNTPLTVEVKPSANASGGDSLRSLFNRIGTKAEVVLTQDIVSKPTGTRSAFLDRLGKR